MMFTGGDEDADYDEDDDFILNEYAIDDSLDPMSRLERYHTSDFSLQRIVLVRELADTAMHHGYQETVGRLLPLLGNFVADSEPAVRQMFVEQLFPLSKFLVEKGGEAGYNELINTFLPYTFELLVDKNVEVGSAAVSTLIKLVDLVKPEQVEPQLLSVVVTLAHDERAEDYRVVSAQLFNELAPRFGEQLCKDTVVTEVIALSDDMSFSVRKTVASSLEKICQVVGKEYAVEKVFPVYVALSKDDIWGVRKACAESICQMSDAVTSEVRTSALFDIFVRFTEDVSRWVRVAAFQHLGPLIATCPPEEVTTDLLKLFTDMAYQSDSGVDSDFAEYCAYSFPGVLQTVGATRWSEMQGSYVTLVRDVQWKVRKSLAHSLHEIAGMVGQEITEETLTQAFDLFLRDLDEVKVGVVNNIAAFVEVLGETQREKYIPTICQLPTESDNWRLRNLIAAKLGQLATLVSPELCKGHIVELAIKLLEDSVAEVRRSSYPSAALIFRRMWQQGDGDGFATYVKGLASHANSQVRQMFACIAREVAILETEAAAQDMFQAEFMDLLVKLSEDAVPNVRIAVAKAVQQGLIPSKALGSDPKVTKMKAALSADKDPDVAYFASAEPTPVAAS